ncbi:PAAR domain-containing protein [Acinetobacter sp. ANC 5579]|uniref:PAAR domain-containing protein n=1 Tax=Acinetobacter amyesii TaxID=2942470 RepID=UPI0020BFADF2|nr:PAAR domain-containing protein [Acinetobacter amyesii]MCL6234153.1 PAAR domain-containing protein [Acinetobacter amyesii]
MKSLITLGSKTSHGGVVSECEPSFVINGIAVHLNGMKHYCPKCNSTVVAIAADQSTTVKGRGVVVAGDKTTCGATFLPNQSMVGSQK